MNATPIRQLGLLTPFLETVAETIGRKRLAERCFQKCHAVGRCRIDNALQFRVYPDLQADRFDVAVLVLRQMKITLLHMLAAELDQI